MLDSHIDGDVEIVDAINLIRVFANGKEAMKDRLEIQIEYVYIENKM